MLQPVSCQTQFDAAQADRLRVLVVGAGVAGLTLAQSLRRRGLNPVLIEKAQGNTDTGYMLALLPMTEPVLDDLGLRAEFRANSVEFDRYVIRTHRGAVNKTYAMGDLLSRYGEYRGISRGELMRTLATHEGPVTFGTTVTAIEQPIDGPAHVTLETGDTSVSAEFDLVVIADGLHSSTRNLVLPESELDRVDTGWGGWVAWTQSFPGASTVGEELWGAGSFVGSYPVAGKCGAIVAGPNDRTKVGPAAFVARLREELSVADERVAAMLTAVAEADDPYYWRLTDCRARKWAHNRVLLLGDAAVGFLPTAGIGAGMAMESAWVLSQYLSAATTTSLPNTLAAYEAAQGPRVRAAQQNSRQLASMMFNRSKVIATIRDIATKVIPLRMALRPIQKLLETGPQVTTRDASRQ